MRHVLIILFLTASAVAQESGNRAPLPLTRETLWRSFPADIREMVYRWDQDDPRTDEERTRALFDFMYEGFDSAAWVPQSLFKRKELLAPFGDPDAIITRTIGLIGWPRNHAAKTYGMAPRTRTGSTRGLDCELCDVPYHRDRWCGLFRRWWKSAR